MKHCKTLRKSYIKKRLFIYDAKYISMIHLVQNVVEYHFIFNNQPFGLFTLSNLSRIIEGKNLVTDCLRFLDYNLNLNALTFYVKFPPVLD